MRLRSLFVPFLMAAVLAACGGGSSDPAASRSAQLTQRITERIVQKNPPIIFSGPRVQYKITANETGYTITDLTGIKQPVTATANDRLRFADTTIALDLNGPTGQAYRLYRAAFNRTPDAGGLAYWTEVLDRGADLAEVANAFTRSAEFLQLYGNSPNNRDLLVRLYFNILRRSPDAGGLAYWQDILDNRKATLAQVLVGFSESQENQTGVKTLIPNGIPLVESGVQYTPQGAALSIIGGGNRPVAVSDLVTLDGSASVLASGRLPVYGWTFDAVPSGSQASLMLANTARPSFVPDLPGNYVVRLTVGDGREIRHASTVTINAIPSTIASSNNNGLSSKVNYVYLTSDNGDYIGQGKKSSYTQTNSILKLTVSGATIKIEVTGDERWTGYFTVGSSISRPAVGIYSNLGDHFGADPVTGGLNWSGDGWACGSLSGDFSIDSITYDGNAITSLDLRFNQYCPSNNSGRPGLHGRIHWVPEDNTVPPGPLDAIPSGLWQPRSTRPTTGNYVILESQTGDYIGGGQTYVLPESQNTISISASGDQITFRVGAIGAWQGSFQTMNVLSIPKTGYYGSLQRFPFHNPTRGGFSWTGNGAGCNESGSWVAIDNIKYTGTTLSELDMRFEQHCENQIPALRGLIHYVAPPVTTP